MFLWHVELWTENDAKYKNLSSKRADFLKTLKLTQRTMPSEPQLEPSKVTCCTSLTLSRRSRKMEWIGNPEHLWHVELWTENHAKYKKLPFFPYIFLKHGCLMISLKGHKQRNETNTFELMAFSVRVENRPKAFKTFQNRSKHLKRDPWRPLSSNRADFLKTLQISADFLKTS